MPYTVKLVNEDNEVAATVLAAEKIFESGGEGYYSGDKIILDGRLYQVSMSISRIGSKDEPEAEARRKLWKQQQAEKEARRNAKNAARNAPAESAKIIHGPTKIKK